jgi:Tfp pilus assembly protein FimT
MPPDPKKPIEELLEASAQARRAEFGAAPEMPNPMRARLHDEIARLSREEQPRERRSWLAMLWPQISIATAVAAVLVTAGVLWLGHRSGSGNENMQLAMRAPASAQPEAALKSLDAANEVVAQSKSAPDAASELTLPEATSVAGSLADNTTATQPLGAGARTDSGASALQKFADVAIPPAAPAEPVDAEEKAKELEAQTRDVLPPPVVAANAPPKNLANAEAAGASSFRNQKTETAHLQQRFSQTARGQALRSNAKFKQAANVLNTFQVEQDGRQIRVVDEDGSTYTGKLETVGQDAARSRAEGKTTAAAPAARSAVMREKDSASGENELYFRATGYNASLKKQVVFEGNYITPPATAPNPSDQKTDEQAPARIIGKAKVPGEAPVEIDAIAVRR